MFTGGLHSGGDHTDVTHQLRPVTLTGKRAKKPAGTALSSKQEITPAECLTLILFFT